MTFDADQIRIKKLAYISEVYIMQKMNNIVRILEIFVTPFVSICKMLEFSLFSFFRFGNLKIGSISHKTFMKCAEETFRKFLIQEHNPDDLKDIAIKAHPEFWHKELMEELDTRYKIIAAHGSFYEQKLALREATLNYYDSLIFHNMVLEQNENNMIKISKNFTEYTEIKDIWKYHLDIITFSHYMALSFLIMSERLGDEGDWLDKYKPAVKLATESTIAALLNRDSVKAQLLTMTKNLSEEIKMQIINGLD